MLDSLDHVQEQIAYYRARAAEYDQWFLRQGRYDRGEDNNRHWFDEVRVLRRALNSFEPQGDILELACGTGLWTSQLLEKARHITAVDASPEMIEINRNRLQSPRVEYVQADIFGWQPDKKYDIVFFAFWLSHVPPERFEGFWQLVAQAVRPGGRIFFMDSRREKTSTASDHQLPDPGNIIATRKLNDGREFNIVKVCYRPKQLVEKMESLGWQFVVNETPRYFIYGSGRFIGIPQ